MSTLNVRRMSNGEPLTLVIERKGTAVPAFYPDQPEGASINIHAKEPLDMYEQFNTFKADTTWLRVTGYSAPTPMGAGRPPVFEDYLQVNLDVIDPRDVVRTRFELGFTSLLCADVEMTPEIEALLVA